MTGGNLVHALYGHRADDDPAFIVPGGPILSTGKALAAIDRAAGALKACGVEPGDRVSVRVEKCVEAVMLAHACFKTGAILHPMNTAYTPREVEVLLADARPVLFVCDPDEVATFGATAAREGFRIESLRGDQGSFAELARSAAGLDAVELPEEAPAALLYTSGTTGRPKGALITHGNLAASAGALVKVWQLGREDVLMHALPAYHAHGLLTAINVMLTAGGAVCFLARFEAGSVLRELPRCSVMMGVPTHYARLLKEPGLAAAAKGAFRLAISGSAPLPPDTADRFRRVTGMEIIERYGTTEAAIITAIPPGTAGRRGWVGWPLPGVQVRVAGEDGRLESAATGVLETRGHNVFAGYWNRPEERAFTDDGWFVTGDVAEIDREGCIRILGRETDVVISGGLNVYPKEVEDVLDRSGGVAGSAVFGVPHPDFGEAVAAVVESPTPASFDESACIGYLKTELASYKVPKRIIAVESIPRNELGKVAKAALRERYRDLFNSAENVPNAPSSERRGDDG